MKLSRLLLGACGLALALFTPLSANAAPEAEPNMEALAAEAAALQWQTGTVDIKNGLAKINLTPDFRFLDAKQAQKVLHDMWGNPENPRVLGMIFPADKGPLDKGRWAVTVRYDSDGYVKDDDADKINYTDMLKELQEGVKEANPERVKEGYPAIEIVGWAAPPRYDKANHKLYWAKEIKFEGEDVNTLNYDIRILGRRGVLILGAIASIHALPEIQAKVPELLAMVDFQSGNTYADFDPKVDKIAEYGLGALVAGGALAGAAKLGLLGVLWKWIIVIVLMMKKAIIVVVIAVVAGAKALWSKFTNRASTDHLLPPKG